MSQSRAGNGIAQVSAVLKRRLKLESPHFELESVGQKVSGSVISPSFRGQRDSERQRRIWDALDAEWGPASVQHVGSLLAFTPDEWNIDSDAEPGAGPARSTSSRR